MEMTTVSGYNGTNHTISQDDIVLKQIVFYMNKYFIPVVIFTGLFGNVVSAVAFLGTYLRRMSLSVYLAALSISDTIFLLCLFIIWLEYVHVPIFHTTGVCQLVIFSSFVSAFLSVWFVVSFSVERFIAIGMPLRKPELCTTKRARITVAGLTMFAVLAYSVTLWTSGVKRVRQKYVICTPLSEYTEVLKVLTFADAVLTMMIPFVALLCLNVTIACRIWFFQKGRWILPATETLLLRHHGSRSVCVTSLCKVAQIKVTKTLLVVSTVFLILNLPSYAVRLRMFLTAFIDIAYTTKGREYFIQQLSQMLYYCSFSVNFFLYSFCSDRFRQAMGRLLWQLRYKFFALWERHYQILRRAFSRQDPSSGTEKKTLRKRDTVY